VAGSSRRYRRIISTLVAVAIGTATVPATTEASAQVRPFAATACASGIGPSDLNTRFANGIGPVRGLDYQRSFPLPGGRTLWLFQDAFIRVPSGTNRLVHNIGMVQSGRCFTLLRSGTPSNPRPWIGARRTTPLQHWFWPLAGTVAADGTFKLFVAEMVERGPRYLTKTEPVATWIATISLPRLQITSLRPAPNPSPQLYGWSVVDDGPFTYLFGHCYRQFGWSFLGHHPCAANVRVARVPRGRLGATPTYWNGVRWSARARSAVNVAPRRGPRGEARDVNPMQVAQVGRCWIAVTKVGDWFGDSIYLDRAPSPAGPWRTAAVIPARPLGPTSTHNTYFASLVGPSAGAQTIGLSNNRWDGALSGAYRPTFRAVPLSTWGPC
jgi:hypothetical protein